MRTPRAGKIIFPIILFILLVSSFYLTAIILKAVTPQQPASTPVAKKTQKITTPAPVTINPPARLEVAAIGVNTLVKPVGVTTDGDMAIDEDITTVAWYEPGPKPGEKGSAVLAGHYGWKGGQASVFNNLHTLKVGDKVAVSDVNNKRISFIVQKIQSYDPAADATEVFQSSDGKAHLNLITCEGSWNSGRQTYSQRLVVFTDRVE